MHMFNLWIRKAKTEPEINDVPVYGTALTFSNSAASYGKSDITHNISFDLFNKIIKKLGSLSAVTTKQRHFLTKLGIFERAEIISKNIPFSKKTDIFYRIKRLIDKDQMGDLFKVLFITKKENKFTLGF